MQQQAGALRAEEDGRGGAVADARRQTRGRPLGRRVVAVLPPSRLALPEERRWLAEAAGARAKGYAMGAQVWIAVSQGTASEESATREAEEFGQKVRARFGPTASARHGVVAHDFALTVAQLTGLKPRLAVVEHDWLALAAA